MIPHRLILTLAALLLGAVLWGSTPKWEAVGRMLPTDQTSDISGAALREVRVADGYVYVAIVQESDVKVVTILGQTVACQRLRPGSYRMKLPSRGVYLLKVGDSTRRITL